MMESYRAAHAIAVRPSGADATTEELRFSKTHVTSLDWVTYPILRFKDAPEVTPVIVQRADLQPLGAGEPTSMGASAAIANAFFDATGIRIRLAPLTPAKVRVALKGAGI